MRRNLHVARCRRTLIHASGEIESGAVTRTEETALPVGVECLGAQLDVRCGGAEQVGTQPYQDQYFRFARTVIISSVLWLLGLNRVRVLQAAVQLRQRGQCFGCTLDHEDRATTPGGNRPENCALFQSAHIDPDSGAGSTCLGAGTPGPDEGHYRAHYSSSPDYRGRPQ